MVEKGNKLWAFWRLTRIRTGGTGSRSIVKSDTPVDDDPSHVGNLDDIFSLPRDRSSCIFLRVCLYRQVVVLFSKH